MLDKNETTTRAQERVRKITQDTGSHGITKLEEERPDTVKKE